MVTLVDYAAALHSVQSEAKLLSREFSRDAALALRASIEGSLAGLTEPCEAFEDVNQHNACRQIHEQAATLLALLRELLELGRPVQQEVATHLARQLVATIDRHRPLLDLNDGPKPAR